MATLSPIEFNINYYILINVYYIIVVSLYWHKNISKVNSSLKSQPFFLFLVLLHLIFAYDGGDFYHYAYNIIFNEMDDMEPIYSPIASFVDYNYLFFRLIVWGIGLLLYVLTAKRLGLDSNKAVYVLYVMFITIYDYARASLAMSIYFYGLSFLCIPLQRYKKFVSIIIGVIIILISLSFHRSMIIPALLSFVIVIPFSKKSLYIFILLFIFSSPVLRVLINQIVGNLLFADQVTVEKAEKVAELDFEYATTGRSFFELVRQICEYTTIILPLVLLSLNIFNKSKIKSNTAYMVRLYKLTIAIVFVAFSVLLVEVGNFIIFYRFLYMAIIPVSLLFLYGRKHNLISDRWFKIVIVLCILVKIYGAFKVVLGGNFS